MSAPWAARSASSTSSSTTGERTRRVIVEVGYWLFVRQGYNATSMRQIADEVGLSLGAAYNHFAGEEEVSSKQ